MANYKTSLLITVHTPEPVKATAVSKLVRSELQGQEIYSGTDKNRKAVRVSKVTVSHVGEK